MLSRCRRQFVYRQSCGGRLNESEHRMHVGRSHTSRLYRQRSYIGAHEPVVVCRVELHAVAVAQNPRPADERHEMEVDDVEARPLEQTPQLGRLRSRRAGEIRDDRGDRPEHVPEPLDGHSRRVRKLSSRLRLREHFERVHAVHDGHLVPAVSQLVREVIEEHRLAPEVVRRKERGDHAERERLLSHAPPRAQPQEPPQAFPGRLRAACPRDSRGTRRRNRVPRWTRRRSRARTCA